jgi:hypothetical protein
MTAEEAWKYILERHTAFHKGLRKFGYKYNTWVPKPNNEHIKAMFEKEKLTEQDIKFYKNFFITEIYNADNLRQFDSNFVEFVRPMMEKGINKFLVPLLPNWNAVLPKKLEILCTYGVGAGYSRKSDEYAVITFRMSRYPDNKESMLDTMLHEFIHLLIEKPIIEKYNVPHNFKERIVDLIGTEFFGKHIQERFVNAFVDKYITPEAIKTDLPGAVAKMMTDYNALQQKQMQQRQSL